MNTRPVGIDLFSGAGGLSLGFEQAGFDVSAAIEVDPIHAATHQFNFPYTAIIPRSVTETTGNEILALPSLRGRKVCVVFGGPPCQGFSMIGHRAMDDPRNLLVREFLRLVMELDAEKFVFENVKGLTIGRHRDFLEELIEEFYDAGYDVAIPWKVLNSRDYGVPQNRERIFLIGTKRGLSLPEYPLPSGDQVPTCEDALGDLPDPEEYDELIGSDSVLVTSWMARSGYAKELRCETDGAWHFGYRRAWNPLELTSSMRTEHTEESKRRFSETMGGKAEPKSRLFRLPRNGICNTLRAGTDSSRGAFTSPRPIHYVAQRCITVREMARLHGYPDWFRFHRTKWHGARQVGNSVPPPLGRAVASSVMASLSIEPFSPSLEIELGNPELLSLDMSGAARHFGIGVPIRRRVRNYLPSS